MKIYTQLQYGYMFSIQLYRCTTNIPLLSSTKQYCTVVWCSCMVFKWTCTMIKSYIHISCVALNQCLILCLSQYIELVHCALNWTVETVNHEYKLNIVQCAMYSFHVLTFSVIGMYIYNLPFQPNFNPLIYSFYLEKVTNKSSLMYIVHDKLSLSLLLLIFILMNFFFKIWSEKYH